MSQAGNVSNFSGKVVLVTGGTSGIGRAAAELFHAAGAHVVVTGQSAESVRRAESELPAGVTVLQSDARRVDAAAELARVIEATFGRLDVVLLNAGIAQLAPLEHVDEAHYDEHMDVNVKGVVFTLQKVLPLLSRGASVIVTSSVAALQGAPNMSIYAASKAAVSGLVRTLAVELAPRGIRINSVIPGPTHTRIQEKFGLPADVREAAERSFAGRIPLGRFGEAQEVAQVLFFLASPGASYVSGAELSVDGGLAAT